MLTANTALVTDGSARIGAVYADRLAQRPRAEQVASAAAWPGTRHQRVEALGHRHILDDPAVVASATELATAIYRKAFP
jgi:hypothetical protein